MPSASLAVARNVTGSFARTLAGPERVTVGAWLPSVTVPLKSSSSGTSSPMPQFAGWRPGVRGSSSRSREQTLSTTTR